MDGIFLNLLDAKIGIPCNNYIWRKEFFVIVLQILSY